MKKTLFAILLAAFLANGLSQTVQAGAVTFFTTPAIVQSYVELIAQQHATPAAPVSAGQVPGGLLPSFSLSGSGFVKCGENVLHNDVGRQIDQVISAKASGLVTTCLLCGVIEQESGFSTASRSGKGAQGLMQLMPDTARGACGLAGADLNSVEQNIDCGARYLSGRIMDFGDVSLGLAAYNCGPNCVRKQLASHGNSFDAISSSLTDETRNYVPNVLANAQRFKQNGLC